MAAAFVSHALSVVVKRIVQRKRPHDPRIQVGVKTPSELSFPSSHATSTGFFAFRHFYTAPTLRKSVSIKSYPVGGDRYWMPTTVAFILIGGFLWLAENLATALSAWRYPDQAEGWHLVHTGKFGS